MLTPVKITFTIANRIRPKFMKTNLSAGLSALCAILLIVLLILQTKQKTQLETLRLEHQAFATATEQRQQEAHDAVSKLADQMATLGTNLESRLVQGEQQANEKMGATMNMVQQNTAVLHRAIGNKLAVELPESVTNELAALEARIADTNSWPQDSTNADAMIAELRDLVRQIPPWAEEDYLPRLNAVRWGASALTLVAKAQTVTDDALEDFLDDVDAAIQAKPDGASELVAKRLTEIQSNPDFQERVQKLQQDFQARVLSDDTSKFIASVDAGLVRTTNEPSLTVRQISFGKLLDSVISQRQILLENTNADASLPGSLTALAARIEKAMEADVKSQEADQEKKSRDYQRWALSQIAKFNSDVDVDLKGVSGIIHDSPDYPEIKNDMVKYLVPISVGLLDPAVSRLYNQAFERGWHILENRKDLQTEVAKQEAVVQKHKP
jgi:hypothetical protein